MEIAKYKKILDEIIKITHIFSPFSLSDGWILMRTKENIRPKKHICNYCKKDHETELFIGYNGSVLWFGGDCLSKMKSRK